MLASAAAESRAELRCGHCGRQVAETRHSRTSYRVDYYSLHTGEVEPVTLIIEDEGLPMTFQKLVSAVDVITCVDCYRAPAVRGERERRFRPERAGGDSP